MVSNKASKSALVSPANSKLPVRSSVLRNGQNWPVNMTKSKKNRRPSNRCKSYFSIGKKGVSEFAMLKSLTVFAFWSALVILVRMDRCRATRAVQDRRLGLAAICSYLSTGRRWWRRGFAWRWRRGVFHRGRGRVVRSPGRKSWRSRWCSLSIAAGLIVTRITAISVALLSAGCGRLLPGDATRWRRRNAVVAALLGISVTVATTVASGSPGGIRRSVTVMIITRLGPRCGGTGGTALPGRKVVAIVATAVAIGAGVVVAARTCLKHLMLTAGKIAAGTDILHERFVVPIHVIVVAIVVAGASTRRSVAPISSTRAFGTVSSHVAGVATDTANDVCSEVLAFRAVVLTMTDLSTCLER